MRKWIVPALLVAAFVAVLASLGGRTRSGAGSAAPEGGAAGEFTWSGPSAEALARALRGDRAITGRVVDAGGVAVPGASVEAIGADPAGTIASTQCTCRDSCPNRLIDCGCEPAATRLAGLLPARTGEPPVVSAAVTAADGTFILGGLAEASFHLWARHGGSVVIAESIPSGADVELQLGVGSFLRGRTLGSPDVGLPRVSVFAIHKRHGRIMETTSVADGSFALGPVPPGDYLLLAVHGDRVAQSKEVTAPSDEPVKLELSTRKRLEGTTTSGGAPVAGAHVVATKGPVRRQAESGSEGRFALDDLADGEWTVVATRASEVATREIRIGGKSAPAAIRLELGFGVVVAGTVRDDRGRPIADARVSHSSADWRSGNGYGEVRTDAEGRFRTRPLAPGRYEFEATATGYAASDGIPQTVAETATEFDFRLEPEASARGVVLDPAGRPLRDATVELWRGEERRRRTSRATTLADGRFTVHGLRPGPHRGKVEHERFKPATIEAVLPGGEIRVTLEDGIRLTGRVLGHGEAPVEGASVEALLEEATRSGELLPAREVRTDSQGRFALSGLVEGKYVVSAKKGSLRSRRELSVTSASPAPLELRLGGGLSIRGRVVDGSGRPVVGATVMAALPPGARAVMEENLGQQSETGSDGTFVVSGLEPGDYVLIPSVHEPSFRTGKEGRARAGDSGVELSLAPRRAIAGRVVDAGGAGVAHFAIYGQRFEDPSGRFEYAVDGDGEEERFLVSAPGFAPARVTVRLRPEGITPIPDVVLSEGRVVVGRVIAAGTGRPVAGAAVEAGPPTPDPKEGALATFYRSGSALLTRSDGTFRLETAPVDPFTIAVRHPRFAPRSHRIPQDTHDVTVELAAGAAIFGRVRWADGRPIAGALVHAAGPDGASATTGPDGSYEVAGLPSGKFLVNAITPQDRSPGDAMARFGFRSLTLKDGERAQLDLTERGGGATLTVTITTSDGSQARPIGLLAEGERPAPAAGTDPMDFIRSLEGFIPPSNIRRGGPQVFNRVPAGRYTFYVFDEGTHAPTLPIATQVIDVAPSGEQALEIRLPPSGAPAGSP